MLSPQEAETHKLVYLAQQGDKAATERLLKLYETKIQQIARSVLKHLIGYEYEDIIQQARISFWDIALSYDLNRKTNFEYFVRICMKKQLISTLKKATKCRNKPLNEGKRLDAPYDMSDDDGIGPYDMIEDDTVDVERTVILKQEASWLDENLKKRLTELERQTYEKYNEGYTYREIASSLERTEKTIDNAIMRVRNKAKEVIKQYITNILVKEEPLNLEEIISQYGWNDVDDMVSSLYNGFFHIGTKNEKRNSARNVPKNKKTTSRI